MAYNHDYLVQEYGLDIAKELVTIFYNEYKDIESKITNLNDKDIDNFVHKLKGSSGSLGIKEIYELCVEFRNDLQNKTLLDKIILQTNNTVESMEKYL